MTLQITTFLTVPDSSAGRAAFVAAANQFGDDLTPMSQEANAMAVEMNANAMAAAAAKTDAQTAKGLAEDARDAALNAATSIADDYNPASHAYAKNDLAWDGPGELYRCILAYTSTATTPANDATHWARVNLTPDDVAALNSSMATLQATVEGLYGMPVVTVSAPRALVLSDRGCNLKSTASLTIPAHASMPVGFVEGAMVVVTNHSSSSISVTPDSGVTLRLAGTTKTGAVTIGPYGKGSFSMESVNLWFASGVALS